MDPLSGNSGAPQDALRLDTIQPSDTPQASAALLRLQARLLDALRPDGPATVTSIGQAVPPTHYFTDLRLLAILIGASWPVSRDSAPTPELAQAIDRHVEHQLRLHSTDSDRAAGAEWTSGRQRLFDAPPLDAAACAGLLAIAQGILDLPNSHEVTDRLRDLVPTSTRQAARSYWGNLVHRSAVTNHSPALRDACDPLLRIFTRPDPHAKRNPTHRVRFGPEHIPAFLPRDWYEQHFSHCDGVNPTLLRRTASVRLVQMIAGGSLGDAAMFLGINPAGKQFTSSVLVHVVFRQQADPRRFDIALHSLADTLNTTPNLINYLQRRRELQEWSLNQSVWNDILAQLPPTPGHNQPELGDRKRQLASIYIWGRLTQGEHLFAPRPIEAQQPQDVQLSWQRRRNTIWHHFQKDPPLRHYAELKLLLDQHADQLANQIDGLMR